MPRYRRRRVIVPRRPLVVAAPTPTPPGPPWPLQRNVIGYYGNPANAGWLQSNTTHVTCPWPLYCEGERVANILIHKRCADSLTRVLNNIWDKVDNDLQTIHNLKYDIFDGSYNFRRMRSGLALSMHSYACAIDFAADFNQFRSYHHLFQPDSLIVTAFEAEKWVWGGHWMPPDAMHFQAALLHL